MLRLCLRHLARARSAHTLHTLHTLPTPAWPRSARLSTTTTTTTTSTQSHTPTTADAAFVLHTYARPPHLVFSHGSGTTLFASDGRSFLDFGAGIAVNALGHADPAVTAIIADQAAKLIHISNLYHNLHAGPCAQAIIDSLHAASAARRLADPADPAASAGPARYLDADGARVFFTNSGTEANEGALKFAKKYAKITSAGSPSKFKVLSFANGFHGRSLGALSATHNPKYQTPFLPLVPGFDVAPLNDIAAARSLISKDTCAVIVEPIQGEGGIHAATPEFLRALRSECDAVGALLIFDEIQCGVGRTGKMFAHEHAGVVPDILTMAKPLANGLPMGAIVVSADVAAVIKPGDHGTTFGGSPLATRVAHHVWSRISAPDFLAAVTRSGDYLLAACRDRLLAVSPLVCDVRGKGLMVGVQLRDHVSTAMFVDLARDRGVLVISASSNTIRLVPALTVSKADIDKAVSVFEEVLGVMEGLIGAGKDLKA
ncbi:pyridoxal phosphate-dependent transferase [Entophlyctis helioformis]|nr:pyridoxal phosphate-dependent transferase [Entophlyctis helioformis]